MSVFSSLLFEMRFMEVSFCYGNSGCRCTGILCVGAEEKNTFRFFPYEVPTFSDKVPGSFH